MRQKSGTDELFYKLFYVYLCLIFQGLSNDAINVKICLKNNFCVFYEYSKIFNFFIFLSCEHSQVTYIKGSLLCLTTPKFLKYFLSILLFLVPLNSPWKMKHTVFHNFIKSIKNGILFKENRKIHMFSIISIKIISIKVKWSNSN